MFKPAALISTSGRSHVSRVIRAATCSRYSHVATTAWVARADLEKNWPHRNWSGWRARMVVFEATMQNDQPCEIRGRHYCGLQAHTAETWIESYPGRIWVQDLLDPVSGDESQRLTDAAITLLRPGRTYDHRGAVLAGTRILKWCPCVNRWVSDRRSVYCAETVEMLFLASLFRQSLPGFDPGRDRPTDTVYKAWGCGCWSAPRLVKA